MRVFITAGEPSGDKLGAALIDGLRKLAGDIELAGVGGARMTAAGLTSLFPMEELSVMGIVEVLPKYFHLKRRIRETAEAAVDFAPDVVITIDSPDFSFRVAKAVRAQSNVRIVHYVAPTVWAWRAGRARKMVGTIDQVLALLPFEPPYFEAVGIGSTFVGHPIVAEPEPSPDDIASLRKMLGEGRPVIAALPGSRRGEVDRLAPIFGEALHAVAAQHPDMRVVVPAVMHLADRVREVVRDWPCAPLVFDDVAMHRAALSVADVALTKSGTVSLELAAARTPMVVAYDVNLVSRWIIARLLKVRTVTLVNLVTDTMAVPECVGAECRAERIAPALLNLIAHPEMQVDALDSTMERLGRGGEAPGLRAARAILAGLSA